MVDASQRARHAARMAKREPEVSDPAAAMRLLAHEARVRLGPVPRELDGVTVADGCHFLSGDAFLMRTGEGLNFLYRKGDGVLMEREPGCPSGDEELWLNGSVYAAAACINGFKPIHASAVMFEGRVHAFTGPSGAGKSTLVAALAARGLPMFCDDTLVLDLSDPQHIVCLPGHKRLKLTDEALALTGAERQEQVSSTIAKFYARPAAGDVREPLPLARLVFLEEGPECRMEPIAGAERFARLVDDHYTDQFFDLASSLDLKERFALQARMARQVGMARLIRPRDTARFAESVRLALGLVTGQDRDADRGAP